MSHGALICRGCFTETKVTTTHSQSETAASAELVCPNCGGESFGI